jgi:hypothetical protein
MSAGLQTGQSKAAIMRSDVRNYTFYVEDDRSAQRATMFVSVASDGIARARATELLLRSPHHISVSVYEGHELAFAVRPERRQTSARPGGRRPSHP